MASIEAEIKRRRVTRVTIEFEDGYISELTGEEADKYQQLVIEQSVYAWNHGARIDPLPWKQRNKNCKKCGGTGALMGPDSFDLETRPCECTKGPD